MCFWPPAAAMQRATLPAYRVVLGARRSLAAHHLPIAVPMALLGSPTDLQERPTHLLRQTHLLLDRLPRMIDHSSAARHLCQARR
jgi:hypothetical protein